MGRVSGSIVVDRPIEQVFAFLADGENDKKFSPRILEMSRTPDGPVGVGTVWVSTARDLGRTARHEIEITEFEPPTRIRWTERSGGPVVIADGGYDLEPVGDGTRVSIYGELRGRGPGVLVAPLVAWIYQRKAPALVERIKRAIEAA